MVVTQQHKIDEYINKDSKHFNIYLQKKIDEPHFTYRIYLIIFECVDDSNKKWGKYVMVSKGNYSDENLSDHLVTHVIIKQYLYNMLENYKDGETPLFVSMNHQEGWWII